MNKKLIFAFGLLFIAVVALLFFIIFPSWRYGESALNGFAQCLADKKITMYGASWCSHCQNEKRAFGDAFRFVPYVECAADPDRCIRAGVKSFPTWIFPDGKNLIGEQGIERLSRESGCPLSANSGQPGT
ncbi:MAG: hypothetical protein AAB867_03475 [Patescibacteria group bacterium]